METIFDSVFVKDIQVQPSFLQAWVKYERGVAQDFTQSSLDYFERQMEKTDLVLQRIQECMDKLAYIATPDYDKEQVQDCQKWLADFLPPGATIYISLESVSRSGMSRQIIPFIPRDGGALRLSHMCQRLCGFTVRHGRVRIGGCGMDMLWWFVHCLESKIYIGPSNKELFKYCLSTIDGVLCFLYHQGARKCPLKPLERSLYAL